MQQYPTMMTIVNTGMYNSIKQACLISLATLNRYVTLTQET